MLLRLLLNVTEVTNENCPKQAQMASKAIFFAQRVKKPWPKPFAGAKSNPA